MKINEHIGVYSIVKGSSVDLGVNSKIVRIRPTCGLLRIYELYLVMDIFILDSYVVILFSDKWTSWGEYLGPKHSGT